jgi:hypothetical protein
MRPIMDYRYIVYWLQLLVVGLLSRSIQNLPLNEPIHTAERYRKTTAGQIRNAFTKWIRPSGLVKVTIGPNPE